MRNRGVVMRSLHAPAVVLTASAMAVLVACGSNGGGAKHSPTATPPSPRQTTQQATPQATVDLEGLKDVRLDLSEIRTGRTPAIPWIEGQTLHRGAADVPVGPGRAVPDPAPLVFPFADGALRYEARNGISGSRIERLNADGGLVGTTPATTPVASWDGRHVAWWEPVGHWVQLGDATTGAVTTVHATGRWSFWSPIPHPTWQVTVVGWIGADDVLVRAPGPGNKSDEFWRTSGREVPAWTGQRYVAVSAEAGVALVEDHPYTDPTGVDANCLSAVDIETSAPVWRRCFQLGDQAYPALTPVFSADGKRLAVASFSITTGEPGYELVLDTASGNMIARFDVGRYEGDQWGFETELSSPRFEDDGHLLAVADWRRHDATGAPIPTTDEAVVRCAVDGGCELATAVVAHGQGGDATAPYRLP